MWSETVQEHVSRPRNMGTLDLPTHRGTAGIPGEGPYMIMEFEVAGENIHRAAFQTFGCPAAIACGSIASQVLTGRTIAQAKLLTKQDVTLLLGGLPEGKEHCPALAIEAIHKAFPQTPSLLRYDRSIIKCLQTQLINPLPVLAALLLCPS